MTNYDSTQDTLNHKGDVKTFMMQFMNALTIRAHNHDDSKLEEPEKSFFDKYTPMLASLDYGSDEYNQALHELRPALRHHYANNSHHPEHYADGIEAMNLLDIVEMLADWKAATLRHETGDILKSLEINAKRFGINNQLAGILLNTIEEMGW